MASATTMSPQPFEDGPVELCREAVDRGSGVRVHEVNGSVGFTSDVAFPLYNGVVRTRFGGSDEALDEMLDAFRAEHVPALWWVTDASTPEDLGRRLEVRGAIGASPLVGMSIDPLEADPPETDLDVRSEGDLDVLDQWLRPKVRGYKEPEGITTAFCVPSVTTPSDGGPIRHRVAYRDGRPVACGTLVHGEGSAGVYNVASAPDAPKQASIDLVSELVWEARRRGHGTLIAHATEDTVEGLSGLGFDQGPKIRRYTWMDLTDPDAPPPEAPHTTSG